MFSAIRHQGLVVSSANAIEEFFEFSWLLHSYIVTEVLSRISIPFLNPPSLSSLADSAIGSI